MRARKLAEDAPSFQAALLRWYDAQARDLPWRRAPSLYKTVVSEFMLQQTQVKTVLPYFAAWMDRFPDFAALAAASEESVLKCWEGLGYYTRARNLRRLAQEIAALSPESIPRDAASWLRFPGVGPYAAAAICSIAFGDRAAVIDGNVVRILARLAADSASYANSSEAAKALRPLADALLNLERPGDHNQAMMELGALVCRKQSPQCLICPVASFCEARARGIEQELPRLAKTTFETVVTRRAWVRGPQGVLLHKIPAGARRMRGLHELPTLEQAGLALDGRAPLLTRKRSITRYRITEEIFRFEPEAIAGELPSDCFWASSEEVSALPFSGPHRRWVEELLGKAEG